MKKITFSKFAGRVQVLSKKAMFTLAIVSMLTVPVFQALTTKAIAASLTDIVVALDPATATTLTDVEITFTPVTAITNGSVIEVNYDTGFTGGAALDNGDIVVADTGSVITGHTASGFVAGYFLVTLTTSGNVTTPVTITIGNVNQLTNPDKGNYGWSVSVDIGGAGITFDTGSGLSYVADANDVTVDATVPMTLDMEIFAAATGSTKTNVCHLGVLSVSDESECDYYIGLATNSDAGVTLKVSADAKLNKGSDDINDTVGEVTAPNEEYGFRWFNSSALYTPVLVAAETDVAVPVGPTETTFVTTASSFDAVNNGVDRLRVMHRASISGDTKAGSYDQVVTYTAYTR